MLGHAKDYQEIYICKSCYLNFGPGYLTGFVGLEVRISQIDPAPFVSIHQVLEHPSMIWLGEVDEGIPFVVVPPNIHV